MCGGLCVCVPVCALGVGENKQSFPSRHILFHDRSNLGKACELIVILQLSIEKKTHTLVDSDGKKTFHHLLSSAFPSIISDSDLPSKPSQPLHRNASLHS